MISPRWNRGFGNQCWEMVTLKCLPAVAGVELLMKGIKDLLHPKLYGLLSVIDYAFSGIANP